MPLQRHPRSGFTLAELLITLGILGVIATFTIPKLLSLQQDQKFNAIGKEAMSMVAASYQVAQQNDNWTTNTKGSDLFQYMNAVSADTASTIDDISGSTSSTCDSTHPCVRLHNGAVLQGNTGTMAGTNTTNAFVYIVDPDGVYSNTTNGTGKSLKFFIYYNGRLTTRGNILPNTVAGGVTFPVPCCDPGWYQ